MSWFRDPTGVNHRIESPDSGERRGQLEPQQLLIGGFILVVIAGPLIKIWTQLQTSLSSTPQLSGAWAGLIASLLVLAIIAATLGLD
ncbi:hypothetical protein DU484_18870 (plasmid) [Haloplanus rubicundus]|uniref:Uncharacterized protein n=1 Tax=Haloplanus rubicundus TaxID=1547898 RepID=A0A345EIE9_9EURY|nr:hypothetical protein DU484_18870 [Haloplanus rubicundus]